jgi:hypothetical protein
MRFPPGTEKRVHEKQMVHTSTPGKRKKRKVDRDFSKRSLASDEAVLLAIAPQNFTTF